MAATYEEQLVAFQPHAREEEEAVLGSILINPDVLPFVRGIVQPTDFYIVRHQWIFKAMCKLADHGDPIDLLTVAGAMGDEKLAEAGGPAYLTALVNQVPTSLNAEAYAKTVHAVAIRRQLKQAGFAIMERATTEGDISTIVAESLRDVQNATANLERGHIQAASDLAAAHYEKTTERAAKGGETGVSTGLASIDIKIAGGFQKGELILLGGFSGGGKTSLADTIIAHVAQKHWAYMWSGEMNAEDQTGRIIAQLGGLNSQMLRIGRLQEREWTMYAAAMEQYSALKLNIDTTQPMTLELLRANALQKKAQGKLEFLVIDYVGLLSVAGISEYDEGRKLSRALKVLAGELEVPILSLVQFNREGHKAAEPGMEHIRGSGTWEHDADIILLAYAPEEAPAAPIGYKLRRIKFAKQRNGPADVYVDLLMHEVSTKFSSSTEGVKLNG